MTRLAGGVPVQSVEVGAYTVPTDTQPESDGTLVWDSTTIVVVHVHGGDRTGVGYAYNHAATAEVIRDTLAGVVEGMDALDVERCWDAMRAAVRNMGSRGIASSAYSAVDMALWDLKARLMDVSLVALLGARRDAAPIYGSGGFTSYGIDRLREQLGGWVHEQKIPRVKMKIGRDPASDPARVAEARDAIGPDAELFVDANGAYDRRQAVDLAGRFAGEGVSWFEEPVSSDDRNGLRFVREHTPPAVRVTAGEYGWSEFHFRDMLRARATDVLQPNATRCGGYTGFLRVAELCAAWHTPISAHTAPQIHAHVACAAPGLLHLEYFHDHDRIERLFFDGVLEPEGGALRPDRSRAGNGLEFKPDDAERFRA